MNFQFITIGCLLLGIFVTSFCISQDSILTGSGLQSQDIFYRGMEDGVECYRIPALITAPNGDLIAAIDERVPSCGDLKWSRDINIVIRRSMDNGNNWTSTERIIDFPIGQSASDPSMIVDSITGKVIMFYNFMDHDVEKDVYYFHMITSDDNGLTWSDPIDITSQITPAQWHNDFKFITSGRGIQTSDGTLLHCLVNLEKGMHVFGSYDHGKSWTLIGGAISPGNESKIIEMGDGSWMINSRTNGTGLRYIHISDDNGKTWQSSPDSSLIDPGCNASIINVQDKNGKQLLIFSNAKTEKDRHNMTIRISKDNGKTWNTGKTIYSGSSAYSTMTILKNEEIGLLFEMDNYAKVSFAKFSLSWLINDID